MKKTFKALTLLLMTGLLASCGSVSGDEVVNIGGPKPDDPNAVLTHSSEKLEEGATYPSPLPDIKETNSQPVLTQAMLDVYDVPLLSFTGIDYINVYTIQTSSLVDQYQMPFATQMDGENWVASFIDSTTNATRSIFFANHNNLACEVGLSLENDADYIPMIDDYNHEITWEDSGLYNSIASWQVSDFTLNTSDNRYHYSGGDSDFLRKITAAATPYDCDPVDLSLIIDVDQIIGLEIITDYDFTLAAGYKARQELLVALNFGDSTVRVPELPTYTHHPIHDALGQAITNMQNLDSYNVAVKMYMAMVGSSAMQLDGFYETVTPTDLYYQTYQHIATTVGDRDVVSSTNVYGFHKFAEDRYNSYYPAIDGDQNIIPGEYVASRAYKGNMDEVRPSFAFAPEIFTSYYVDSARNETTYYVDDIMSQVAMTFAQGISRDLTTYAIFATRGYTSDTSSFTPYVTVGADGYIVDAGYYFNMGVMYGVVEIVYSNFNTASLPSGVDINFDERQIPTSWSEHIFTESETSTEYNALEYFKEFFSDENIDSKLPLFEECIDDTFGFGLISLYRPAGAVSYVPAVQLYYDVPLDSNYTIDSSLRKIYNYLESKGFTNNGNYVYVKDNITVVPVDNELDLNIYIYRTSGRA